MARAATNTCYRAPTPGDAALSFDPVSSQGIFNALYTGIRGAQAIDTALAGDRQAVPAYAARLEQIRSAYVGHHRLVYQAERRWTDHPFWTRQALST